MELSDEEKKILLKHVYSEIQEVFAINQMTPINEVYAETQCQLGVLNKLKDKLAINP